MPQMHEDDLRFFAESVKDFFGVVTGVPANITSAYLATGAVPTYEFTGVITLSGSFSGHVLVSAPRALLRDFLVKQHETDTSEGNLLDAVGEIANTIAGNARRKFGADLSISVPLRFKGAEASRAKIRQHPFVISMRWGQHEALVCVDLEKIG